MVEEEQVPMDNIYQNIDPQISTGVIYKEVLKKEQPVTKAVMCELTVAALDEDESTKISVRDLVKKFNR